jgi:predicted nucleic acid-binding protein
MLYLDTCVLLALLTPEIHSSAVVAFVQAAAAPLAISPWSTTELHSALGFKVRSQALSPEQADAVLQGFERHPLQPRCPVRARRPAAGVDAILIAAPD